MKCCQPALLSCSSKECHPIPSFSNCPPRSSSPNPNLIDSKIDFISLSRHTRTTKELLSEHKLKQRNHFDRRDIREDRLENQSSEKRERERISYFDGCFIADGENIRLTKDEDRSSENGKNLQRIIGENSIPQGQQLIRSQITRKRSHQPFEGYSQSKLSSFSLSLSLSLLQFVHLRLNLNVLQVKPKLRGDLTEKTFEQHAQTDNRLGRKRESEREDR